MANLGNYFGAEGTGGMVSVAPPFCSVLFLGQPILNSYKAKGKNHTYKDFHFNQKEIKNRFF